MADSRRALRDFYKLPSEAASETGSEAGSEAGSVYPDTREPREIGRGPDYKTSGSDMLVEAEEEPLTRLEELDSGSPDVAAFIQKLEEQPLTGFVATAAQIRREQATLASAQRELVNDNYKKLIQAAEMLGYLSSQGDLTDVDKLADSVNTLAQWAQRLPQ